MLQFNTIRWMNFLSTGNQWTEVEIDKHKSTLVLGNNGAGKSTMLDALTFCLYGKPFRNINKPQLINSITGKKTVVEVEFTVRGNHYLVRRGIKPNIFEVYENEKLLDQDANVREYQDFFEKNILQFNYKTFKQIVVVGITQHVPFMELTPADRRAVIEDLLDIEVFSKMLLLLKDMISENKTEIVDKAHEVDKIEAKIEMLERHIAELEKIAEQDNSDKLEKIAEYERFMDLAVENSKGIQKEIDSLYSKITDEENVKSKLKEAQDIQSKLQYKAKELEKEISFFSKNDNCPTCTQKIDGGFKEITINEKAQKKQKYEGGLGPLSEQIGKFQERVREINGVTKEISDLGVKLSSEQTKYRTYQKTVENLKNEMKSKKETQKVDTGELDVLKESLDKSKKDHAAALGTKSVYDMANVLLKDSGIKAKVIKEYIPVINGLMDKYLAAMEFFVKFEIDEEFNEKIKSRHRDEFTYNSFSQGEKLRIDLALLFTWRAIAKMRNSVTTNLLILDEVFDSSLDEAGTDEFLKIVTKLTEGTNVFIISHKGDQLYDRFERVLRFEKINNFSRVAA